MTIVTESSTRKLEREMQLEEKFAAWLTDYQERANRRYAVEAQVGMLRPVDAKDMLIVVTRGMHPRRFDPAQILTAAEDGSYLVRYRDGAEVWIGGKGNNPFGGVDSSQLVKIYKPWLNAYDGALLEETKPGIVSMLRSVAE